VASDSLIGKTLDQPDRCGAWRSIGSIRRFKEIGAASGFGQFQADQPAGSKILADIGLWHVADPCEEQRVLGAKVRHHEDGGRLWADENEPRGAVSQFTLPSAERNSLTLFVRVARM
jgi:hypothetical protein